MISFYLGETASAHSDVSHKQDLSTDPEDPPKHELVDMEPDLTVCENVGCEMRDDVPVPDFEPFVKPIS